jgi:hypothetical protein
LSRAAVGAAHVHAAVEDLGLQEGGHEVVVRAVPQRLRLETDRLGVGAAVGGVLRQPAVAGDLDRRSGRDLLGIDEQ